MKRAHYLRRYGHGKSPRSKGNFSARIEYLRDMKLNVVGPSIRELRMCKGWSQAHLSARLKAAGWNCSRSRLAKIESGLVTVRDHDLPYFRDAFAVEIDALYSSIRFQPSASN